ncbi:hypothetical protein CEP54_009965 [Fusarium duplospermum]|uniref:Uncharacterized protein n=1 Tax=Fusarium duplospermum TaxID=1325734 RepID=A0A428PN16_9HYPO|nr:hypothetical protein CEP54_009965 [Fusarium duplospermum]
MRLSLPTPSTAELHRSERALYRFEICCIFYGLPELDDRCWDSWFNKLPKFELEQLSCLNDLLAHLIAPAFNDLIQHDVSWGYFGVVLITIERDALAQDFVSRGLETIHALVQAETFDQRRRILHKGDNPEDKPFGSIDFICESLQWTHSDTLMTGSPISELPTDERALVLGIPTYPDIPGDPGPLRVFELVQHDSQANKLVAQVEFRSYRRWGYVFWDEARLEKLGALTQDGLAKLTAPANPLEAYSMLEYSQLRESRARRSEIWQQGGTGWWSEDDESKVVWPEEKRGA